MKKCDYPFSLIKEIKFLRQLLIIGAIGEDGQLASSVNPKGQCCLIFVSSSFTWHLTRG